MKKSVGPWQVLTERQVFENPWVELVDNDVLRPDGSPGKYGVVRFKNIAVGVLPFDQNGLIPLVGQHRFPSDRYSWELPEGGCPLDTNPIDAAKRELREETGFIAASWAPFTEFDISNSVTDERASCFFAWDLEQGPASPEPSEDLAIKHVYFEELFEMVMSGTINDSLTIVMTLKAHALALRGATPAPISSHILKSNT